MADCKNQEMGYAGKKSNSSSKGNPTPVFNRSMTINSSSSAAAAENNPLYNRYGPQSFQRNGSIKSSDRSSPFGSIFSAGNSFKGKVRKLCSIFESPKQPSSSPSSSPVPSPTAAKLMASDSSIGPLSISDPQVKLPGTEDRVVIYFTSLRGIRRTFQDCHSIRMIFRGFRVNLDERDISMDVAYKKELHKLLGENVSLPQVFIKGKYIGGADLIKQMSEIGDLKKALKGVPTRSMKPCDGCDDVRFLPCLNCSGSRKVFDEDDEQPKRCLECNENGLIRCPLCCS